MEWLSLSPTETELTVLPDQGSLTSHGQHGDGTYSLTSHLTIPSSITPGTTITCRVSHVGLDSPLSVSVLVEHPEPGVYAWLVVFVRRHVCEGKPPHRCSIVLNILYSLCLMSDLQLLTVPFAFHSTDSYWLFVGFLVITVLFFYQVMR